MGNGIDTSKLSSSLFGVQKTLEDLSTKCISDPDNARENLSEALEQLQIAFEELSTADEEILNQNEELIVAHEALKESEKRFRSVLDSSKDFIYRFNLQTNCYEYISPSSKKVIGHSSDVIKHLGDRMILAFIHHEDLQAMQAALERLEVSGQEEVEVRINRADGYHWISCSMSLVKDSSGRPLYHDGIVRDITERKRAEEKLSESEEKFRTVVETSGEGVAIARPNGPFFYVNQRMADMLGYSVDEIIGKSAMDFCSDDWKEQNRQIRQKLHNGELLSGEFKFQRKDGSVLWSMYNASPMFNDKGEHVANFAMHSDITERKRAEEALRESESNLRMRMVELTTLVDVGLDGIIIYDKYGRVVSCNENACRLFSFSDVVKDMNDTFEERAAKYTWRFPDGKPLKTEDAPVYRALNGETIRDVIYYSIKGSDVLWLSASAAPLRTDSGEIFGAVASFKDITDRKLAEEALWESERNLAEANRQKEDILESISDCFYALDKDLRFIYANKAAEEIWDLSRADLIGRKIEDVFAGLIDISLSKFRQSLEEHVPQHYEVYSKVIQRWGDMRVYPTRDGISVYFQDITERKQAEEALRESDARQKFLLSLSDAIRPLDDPIEIQEAAARVLGEHLGADRVAYFEVRGDDYVVERDYAPAAQHIIGRYPLTSFGPDLLAEFRAGRNTVNPDTTADPNLSPEEKAAYAAIGTVSRVGVPLVKGGRFVAGLAVHMTAPCKWTQAEVTLIEETAERTWAAVEQARAEEALRKYKDELEIRIQERTEELSQANKKLEAININLIDEIKGHTKTLSELQMAKEDLGCLNEELQLEIEEEKLIENQLLNAKEAAEAASWAKAAFLANMSHEIRTPMNSILGFTELLLGDAEGPLSPEQKDSLETIRLNGDALLTIINDILDFSKIESGKVVLEEQPFDLRQCVEESLDLVAVRASEKGLNLAYTFDKKVPNTIIGDPGRLRQILGNLLSNAVKFTDEGEVIVSVFGREVNEAGASEIRFAVKDTGIGIPRDHMDKLFQPFNQMEPSTTRLYGGTGLGLVISKRMVELMGGSIWAESEEGIGSTFHFTIKAPSGPLEPEPAIVSTQMIGKRVLIIEDNKTNRRILSKQIYDWGMIPMAAASGQEALRYIQRGDEFDIAILDMDLQTMDSLELEKKIRNHNKTLPLVLLTSLGKHIPANHAYLTKPIKPSRLYQVLTDILPDQPGKGLILVKQPAYRPGKVSMVNQPVQNSQMKILLAEDNASSQKVALQMLKKLGYRADVVANGIEVLQSLECQPYDVVLMDLRMPEMDGLEATRIIRKRWPNNGPKIIAITAYALEGDREKCLEAGMNDYIAKPIQKEDLARALKEINRL